jgi:uncharacterized protein
MTTRDRAPLGSPCWADLWTSDVEGSRKFYGELFGWTPEEPSAEFGGYFIFSRDGAPVAGGMGDMGPDMQADNTWKPYFHTDDIAKTLEAAEAAGAQVIGAAMAVADLGTQAVLVDPTGAVVGAWQPDTFQGFSTLEEPGAPSWVELHTRDHAKAVDFYRSVFHWDITMVDDTDEFRYGVMEDPSGQNMGLAGIMDASGFLPEGAPSAWYVYWEVDDVDATVAKAQQLGGSVVDEPEDTPYGRLATLQDPAGARFKLRKSPA